MIILLLIINSFIGFYTVKVTVNSWRVHWFKTFGNHYYDDDKTSKFVDDLYTISGVILGVYIAIAIILTCNIFSKDSEFYIGLCRGRIFLSDEDIEELVYEL